MPILKELRQKYKKFIYKKYSWQLITDAKSQKTNLKLIFEYKIEPGIFFSPTLVIENVSQKMLDALGKEKINSYVFNIGLAEMFSYWKCTASQNIEIQAGEINSEQIDWWHKLLINGMGEYFFVNKIQFMSNDFVKITCTSVKKNAKKTIKNETSLLSQESDDIKQKISNIIVPIGGGKDSVVTLDILSNFIGLENLATFVVNPTQAALDIITTKKINNVIKIQRNIDRKLIKFNKQKFLNGHVPISAFFAFLSVFTADLFNYTHVAISNERSSNEGNTKFCNKTINHQYSKTYEFESNFQSYVKKYLPLKASFYFSFLRPLYELQIAKIFSKMKKYHPIFRSCNRGQKTNSWCLKCSKCLFAYTILYPFIEDNKIHSHFGKVNGEAREGALGCKVNGEAREGALGYKVNGEAREGALEQGNLFNDMELWPIAQELLGVGTKKPLECVGTHEETIIAFYLSVKKYLNNNQELPALLKKINTEILNKEKNLEERTKIILNSWNNNNSVPEILNKLLKKYV